MIETDHTDLRDAKTTLIKAQTTCPTVMLATNRTVKVSGRIKIEIVSIITKKGAKAIGAPLGDRCAIISFVKIECWKINTYNQIVTPVIALNQNLEVIGNRKGINPLKFNTIRDKNNAWNFFEGILVLAILALINFSIREIFGRKKKRRGRYHI